MNLIVLIGRLTADPEEKKSNSGKTYVKFTVAVNRQMKKDEADFINCTAFGKTAELICDYMKKGSKLGIEGRLQVSRYEKDGEKRNSTEVMVDRVQFLDNKSKDITDDVVDYFGGEKYDN